MKKFIGLFILIIVINTAVPVVYSKLYTNLPLWNSGQNNSDTRTTDKETVQIYDKSSGSMLNLTLKEYLIGAAACEMPALYEENAIKAQMVAIHSYYLYCMDNPNLLENGYIQVEEAKLKGYASATRLMEFWNTRYYDYYAKFEKCADEVADKILTFEGKPAMAVYHAVSCGKTADCKDVWGQNLPYLTSVNSTYDQLSDNYIKIKEFSKDVVFSTLRINYPNITLDETAPQLWFGDIVYADSGYATYVNVGGDMVPAAQLRDIFALPSTAITIFYEDDKFSIATKGYGHGAGLSQFGANQMSMQGCDWQQILAHYFPGTKIETL